MLTTLLVSGWFRVKPFIKYIAILIMISPLVGTSVNISAAKQLDKGNMKLGYGKSKSNSKLENAVYQKAALKFDQYLLLNQVSLEKAKTITTVAKDNYQTRDQIKDQNIKSSEINRAVQANSPVLVETIQLEITSAKDDQTNSIQSNLAENNVSEKAKNPENNIAEKTENADSETSGKVKVLPTNARGLETLVNEQITTDGPPKNGEMVQNDPIGSPHPIPWQWILATQENVGGKGNSGVRYYRSIPVISTDGRYAIYSRVEMTVKPEMHNSRVNSVLFLEDRQRKQLKVLLTTNKINDPLLNKQDQLSQEMPQDGKISVLVPVSWSKTGDRFLARKFVALFNTADATDQAVIWNSQQNNINTIAPNQEQENREKIAILLGWSKNQPNSVLFRSGELGQENWPLVQVANDGKTVELAAEADQAVTFGDRTKIWADPQLASR